MCLYVFVDIHTPGTRLTAILCARTTVIKGFQAHMFVNVIFVNIKLFLMGQISESVFWYFASSVFTFHGCHCVPICSTLRSSPNGIPRSPNRLMHDAYVRNLDSFLKVMSGT